MGNSDIKRIKIKLCKAVSFLFEFVFAIGTLMVIISMGYIVTQATIFYLSIYPDIYNKTILGKTETPENLTLIERWCLVSQEAWPIILLIGISFLILVTAVILFYKYITRYINFKNR